MKETSTLNQNTKLSPPEAIEDSSYKALTIDYALYDEFLKDPSLSEEQRREFLDMLWNIIVNFVDLGFGVHPLQQVMDSCDHTGDAERLSATGKLLNACEQKAIPLEYLIPDSSNMIDLKDSPKTDFKSAVGDYDHPHKERTDT